MEFELRSLNITGSHHMKFHVKICVLRLLSFCEKQRIVLIAFSCQFYRTPYTCENFGYSVFASQRIIDLITMNYVIACSKLLHYRDNKLLCSTSWLDIVNLTIESFRWCLCLICLFVSNISNIFSTNLQHTPMLFAYRAEMFLWFNSKPIRSRVRSIVILNTGNIYNNYGLNLWAYRFCQKFLPVLILNLLSVLISTYTSSLHT